MDFSFCFCFRVSSHFTKYTYKQEPEELKEKTSVLFIPLQELFIIVSKSIFCSMDVSQSYHLFLDWFQRVYLQFTNFQSPTYHKFPLIFTSAQEELEARTEYHFCC